MKLEHHAFACHVRSAADRNYLELASATAAASATVLGVWLLCVVGLMGKVQSRHKHPGRRKALHASLGTVSLPPPRSPHAHHFKNSTVVRVSLETRGCTLIDAKCLPPDSLLTAPALPSASARSGRV